MALTRRRLLKSGSDEVEVQKTTGFASPTKDEMIATWTTEINSEQTLGRLTRLHLIATRPLSLLSTEQCTDLDSIRKLSRATYNTPAYSLLHARVMSLFTSDIVYQPHTVGAFFVGCITPTNLSDITSDVNQGCSLLCSDASLPPPDGPWGFCSQNVLWCVLSSSAVAKNARRALHNPAGSRSIRPFVEIDAGSSPEAFDFIYITHIPSSSKAILFVDYPSYDAFPGFTRHEKARLMYRMDITDIKLLSYERDPLITTSRMAYKDLIGRVVKIHSIKARPDPRDNETIAQRTARRAIAAKTSTPTSMYDDSSSALSWYQAIGLAFSLLLVVILGICCGFLISILRTSPSIVTSQRETTRSTKPPGRSQWRT